MSSINPNDVQRVLKGLSVVMEKVVSLQGPKASEHLMRAQYHASELMKSVVELSTSRFYDARSPPPPPSSSSSSPSSSAAPPSSSTAAAVAAPSSSSSSKSSSPAVAAAAAQSLPPLSSPMTATISSQSVIKDPVINDIVNKTFIDASNSINNDLIGFPNTKNSNDDVSANINNTQHMREREVPSTPIARLMGFGSLGARMIFGFASDRATQFVTGNSQGGMSEENAERLAEALCRMRGAALKLGQMLSLQDDGVLPPALAKALERVKQAADYMPKRQLEAQLVSQLGNDWREKLKEFDMIPIAAASIGQVHRAVLHDGTVVAMKIQYPGVAQSIESDLLNLKRLVTMTNILPPGLFIDQIMKVASTELAWECDYDLEAESQIKYRDFVLADETLRQHVSVPEVYKELSTNRILTSRLVPGIPIDKAVDLSQDMRNAIARTILLITVKELFEWRFIQSDPNFGNFLYDNNSRTINMIDFGAARAYSKEFVDKYMELVWGAANNDSDKVLSVSRDIGFLNGNETSDMMNAHIKAGLVLGEPFLTSKPFDFASSHLTTRVSSFGETFMKYRLTPPPTEAYSLHRKLAGAFLLCIKLKAVIPCRDILETTYKNYKF